MESSSEPAATYTCDQLIPKVEFVNGQTVLACAEDGFFGYTDSGETVAEQMNQTFETELKKHFL